MKKRKIEQNMKHWELWRLGGGNFSIFNRVEMVELNKKMIG